MSDDDRLLDVEQIAELLNVKVGWVREHTRLGHLPFVPLGRYRRYRRSSVLAYIAEQEQGGQPLRRRPRAAA